MALNARQARRDYEESGFINRLFAIWGFVTDQVFLTKAGDVGLVYRLTGIDMEGTAESQLVAYVHRFEAALRLLDESYCLYQYVVKRPGQTIGSRQLYEMDLYLVLLYEGLSASRRSTWTSAKVCSLLDADLTRAIQTLHHTADALEIDLDYLGPVRLGKDAAFQFFRSLVNDFDPGGRLIPDTTHLDYRIADADIERRDDHIMIGTTRTVVLSMKEAPRATFAAMLDGLSEIQGAFIVCVEWQRIPVERALKQLHAHSRHFDNTKFSLLKYLFQGFSTEKMRPDGSKVAVVDQVEDALTTLRLAGRFLGDCSLTVIASGPNANHVANQARRWLAVHDGALRQETYNALFAWASIVPGNRVFNYRRLPLLDTNLADLSALFTADRGAERDDAGRLPLRILPTQQHTAYSYHIHAKNDGPFAVGHTLVLGATGSGKTWLLNDWIDHAQQYQPRTVVFDIGDGYRELARKHGGSYVEFGLDAGLAINPFALSATPDNLHFLHAFCRLLIEGDGGTAIDGQQSRELYDVLMVLKAQDAPHRRLRTVAAMLPRELTRRLERWVEGGRYGHVFDHATNETLGISSFQAFSFGRIRDYPDLLDPMVFYVMNRVGACLSPDVLTLWVMDETWRFAQHPLALASVESLLKTGRKNNVAVLLATQQVEDFAHANLLRTAIENSSTHLFLCNPLLDRVLYAQLFSLNEVELDLLVNLRPRGQVLLKRGRLAKVLDLIPIPANGSPVPGRAVHRGESSADHGRPVGPERGRFGRLL
jgi:type IV secretory pathway VirB4 component